jgi:hypothetical protein
MPVYVIDTNKYTAAVNKKGIAAVTCGRQGPPGIAGVGGGNYEHIQSVASSTWTANHNLGFRPNVSVKTMGGVEVMAEVQHTSVNQTQITFDSPMTGIANFS